MELHPLAFKTLQVHSVCLKAPVEEEEKKALTSGMCLTSRKFTSYPYTAPAGVQLSVMGSWSLLKMLKHNISPVRATDQIHFQSHVQELAMLEEESVRIYLSNHSELFHRTFVLASDMYLEKREGNNSDLVVSALFTTAHVQWKSLSCVFWYHKVCCDAVV